MIIKHAKKLLQLLRIGNRRERVHKFSEFYLLFVLCFENHSHEFSFITDLCGSADARSKRAQSQYTEKMGMRGKCPALSLILNIKQDEVNAHA